MVGAKRWVKESWLGFSTTQLSTDNFLLLVHPTTCQPTKIRDDQQGNMVDKFKEIYILESRKCIFGNQQKMYYKSYELVAYASESESVVSKNSESQASVELVANAVPFGPQATCNSRQNINTP